MEYNSQRERIPLPEYGRNLQKMVDKAVKIEDRDKRTRFAHFLVDIMVQLHPSSKDAEELRHKLWDHLHIMANFRLDIDSPYPMPDKEVLSKQPKPLSYPVRNLKYNFYGRNIQRIIEEAVKLEDEEEREALTKGIANQMKKSYLIWNKDTVDDSLIEQHLVELSKGKLSIPEDMQLKHAHEILGPVNKKPKQQKGKRGQKGQNRRKIKQ